MRISARLEDLPTDDKRFFNELPEVMASGCDSSHSLSNGMSRHWLWNAINSEGIVFVGFM